MVKLRLLLEYSEFRASQEQKIRGRARALSLSLSIGDQELAIECADNLFPLPPSSRLE